MTTIANFVDVGGAEALLDRYVTRIWRALFAQEIGHKLLHARRREQDGRVVVRDQARRWLQVTAHFEPELNEVGADLIARARRHSFRGC